MTNRQTDLIVTAVVSFALACAVSGAIATLVYFGQHGYDGVIGAGIAFLVVWGIIAATLSA